MNFKLNNSDAVELQTVRTADPGGLVAGGTPAAYVLFTPVPVLRNINSNIALQVPSHVCLKNTNTIESSYEFSWHNDPYKQNISGDVSL
ncbi:hypothetical protein XELAEV_18003941mg [Xenopus laevis]|nr:hypothetical protein XELAEV_18003941mg [Xenopus laevis]